MQTLQGLQDSELLGRLKTGDERALEAIYARYWEKMLAVAFHRLDNQEEAEECVQDVLYKLWRLRDTLSLDSGSLSTYLAKAIRNHAFNVLDKRHRERQRAAGFTPDPEPRQQSPEQEVILRELQERIDRAINDLPAQCRIVFTLSREEGLTNKQIAERLAISENTVKSHLKKANRDLRDNLDITTTMLLALYLFGR